MSDPFRRPVLTAALAALLDQRLSRLEAACREAQIPFYDDAGVDTHLRQVLLVSDFAYETLLRAPILLGPELVRLMGDPRHADARAGHLAAIDDEATLRAELRRFRKREAIRLIWRDVNGLDPVESTLAGASVLAECCLEAALRHAERQLAARHGHVRSADGAVQRLVVFGLGKLGGSELNFSSDIDLILAYPEGGGSDGARPLDAETFFTRLGQQVVSLLAEHTVDGYVYRVDLRLRPFGSVGRVALSFAAMEQYYQREGRDWERYAWIKGRPVAGDIAAGQRLIEVLRPFVFRRYFDYTAFAGLREMKTLIDAEVARKDLAANLKLGPGGIREIEFIVQLMQMIRGGREPALRVRGLLPALSACEQLGVIPAQRARRLREAYRFLRRVENRVQMFADQQVHDVPAEDEARLRLALGLGHPDWAAFKTELDRQRAVVAEEFDAVMAPARRAPGAPVAASWTAVWQDFVEHGVRAQVLAEAGFDPPEAPAAALETLLASPALRSASARARARLDRVVPALFAAAAETQAPAPCLVRLLGLVHAVARRSAYLALLDEQPGALKRVTRVFAASAFLADRVTAHPLLLDELFDDRHDAAVPDRDAVEAEIARRLAALADVDAEAQIEVIQDQRLAAAFRIGLDFLAGRLDAVATARALAGVAEAVLASVLRLAERDLAAQHGRLPDRTDESSGLTILGYGSLGGSELGFGSDLDLVFLYDGACAQAESLGPRPLEGTRYYARLAQRVVHYLTTLTRSGRLYEVDVRLRPDGGKGLLVSSLDAYMAYQRERAWTWEHQALVRARTVAGDVALGRRFAEFRQAVLAVPVDVPRLHEQIADMRRRWRVERDRSDAAQFDLKQGRGALVDLEFLLQGIVLEHAAAAPALLASSNSADLIAAAARAGLLSADQAQALAEAHAALLGRSLSCTLDARSRVIRRDPDIERHAECVSAVAAALDFDFATPAR
jgi:glutamate-ammonia-ligase adenylyltransferase